MRVEPKLRLGHLGRRYVIETTPGWTTAELIDHFRYDENGKRRPLAFVHRSTDRAKAA